MRPLSSCRMILSVVLLFILSCAKEESTLIPAKNIQVEEKVAKLIFSGYSWTVRNSNNTLQGPGANYFSPASNVVFIDGSGDLHLKILKKNNKWLCSEVYSDINIGYGRYVFVTKGNVENYDKKIVVGLFTWDDNDYQTQANSELDIEFSKWGSAGNQHVMEYSVQPTYGFGFYPERTSVPLTSLIYDASGYMTHVIDWKSNKVIFETHTGDDTTSATLTQTWAFNNTNPPRSANQGGITSDPIVIPAPGTTTKAHINFWLFDANGNGKGDPPSNGQNAELVLHRFQYVAY